MKQRPYRRNCCWGFVGIWPTFRCCNARTAVDWDCTSINLDFYRAMLRRARWCHSISPVCLSVRPSATTL